MRWRRIFPEDPDPTLFEVIAQKDMQKKLMGFSCVMNSAVEFYPERICNEYLLQVNI